MPPFRIDIPQPVLDDLADRLARTRWPDAVVQDDWSWGTDATVLRTLVDRWTNGYDWRATEARLNALDHVLVGAPAVHAIRAGTPGKTPLLLVHGWPDSFLRFEKALPLLVDRFDIVVPSIPGFGFSDRPDEPGAGPAYVADLLAATMSELGFDRYVVHGGDVGSTISETIAHRHADHVIGLHLGDVPFWHRYTLDPESLDEEERSWADRMTEWSQTEGAYALLQRTKPQTLAYALTDSPIALAAWFLEKFRAWSDNGGDVFSVFTPDELLDDITLYWVTSTAASAARYYRDSALHTPGTSGVAPVPSGFALFPKDIQPAPRAYAERFFDVRRWTRMPRGGHFGPWEQPELFARELRAFVDELG